MLMASSYYTVNAIRTVRQNRGRIASQQPISFAPSQLSQCRPDSSEIQTDP